MKVASWNVNSLRVRLPQVLAWLETSQTDVLALQETKLTDADFPHDTLADAGYQSVCCGQKTYNGVAVVSRAPISEVHTEIPGTDNEQKRMIAVTVGGIRIINLYAVNGESVDSDKYVFKLQWLNAVNDFIAEQLRRYEQVIVLGDFNIAPSDADVHDPKLWQNQLLCSAPERAALRKLLDLGLVDSLRLFHARQPCFSWWDYRGGGFERNLGLRIDLILISCALVNACVSSGVDAEPRGWKQPSDHCPAVAQFADC